MDSTRTERRFAEQLIKEKWKQQRRAKRPEPPSYASETTRKEPHHGDDSGFRASRCTIPGFKSRKKWNRRDDHMDTLGSRELTELLEDLSRYIHNPKDLGKSSRCSAMVSPTPERPRRDRCSNSVLQDSSKYCKAHQYHDPESGKVRCRGVNNKLRRCNKAVDKHIEYCEKHFLYHTRAISNKIKAATPDAASNGEECVVVLNPSDAATTQAVLEDNGKVLMELSSTLSPQLPSGGISARVRTRLIQESPTSPQKASSAPTSPDARRRRWTVATASAERKQNTQFLPALSPVPKLPSSNVSFSSMDINSPCSTDTVSQHTMDTPKASPTSLPRSRFRSKSQFSSPRIPMGTTDNDAPFVCERVYRPIRKGSNEVLKLVFSRQRPVLNDSSMLTGIGAPEKLLITIPLSIPNRHEQTGPIIAVEYLAEDVERELEDSQLHSYGYMPRLFLKAAVSMPSYLRSPAVSIGSPSQTPWVLGLAPRLQDIEVSHTQEAEESSPSFMTPQSQGSRQSRLSTPRFRSMMSPNSSMSMSNLSDDSLSPSRSATARARLRSSKTMRSVHKLQNMNSDQKISEMLDGEKDLFDDASPQIRKIRSEICSALNSPREISEYDHLMKGEKGMIALQFYLSLCEDNPKQYQSTPAMAERFAHFILSTCWSEDWCFRLLNLRAGIGVTRVLYRHILEPFHLISLDLSGNQLHDDGCIELASAMEGNTTLVHLALRSNSIGAAGAVALFDSLRDNTSLVSLDLSVERGVNRNHIGEKGSRSLGALLSRNRVLNRLDISGNGLTAETLYPLLRGLSANVGLRWLNISSNRLDARCVASLFPAVCRSKLSTLLAQDNKFKTEGLSLISSVFMDFRDHNIEVLDISNNGIHDPGSIFGMLKKDTRITELCLNNNAFVSSSNTTGSGWSTVEKCLVENNSLKILKMNNCHLEYKCVEYVINGLKMNTSLQTLDIGNNLVGDRGAMGFADLLVTVRHTRLASLNLSRNGVGLDGGVALAKAVSASPTLRELYLRSNHFSPGSYIIDEVSGAPTFLHPEEGYKMDSIVSKAFAEAVPQSRSIVVVDLAENLVDHTDIRTIRRHLRLNRVRCKEILYNAYDEEIRLNRARLERLPRTYDKIRSMLEQSKELEEENDVVSKVHETLEKNASVAVAGYQDETNGLAVELKAKQDALYSVDDGILTFQKDCSKKKSNMEARLSRAEYAIVRLKPRVEKLANELEAEMDEFQKTANPLSAFALALEASQYVAEQKFRRAEAEYEILLTELGAERLEDDGTVVPWTKKPVEVPDESFLHRRGSDQYMAAARKILSTPSVSTRISVKAEPDSATPPSKPRRLSEKLNSGPISPRASVQSPAARFVRKNRSHTIATEPGAPKAPPNAMSLREQMFKKLSQASENKPAATTEEETAPKSPSSQTKQSSGKTNFEFEKPLFPGQKPDRPADIRSSGTVRPHRSSIT